MSLLQRKVFPRPGRPTRIMISFCRSGRRLLRRPADPNAPLDLRSAIVEPASEAGNLTPHHRLLRFNPTVPLVRIHKEA